MDNLGFQGMPRFPLTPAEEALVPRPHASASQVATAVPSTYTRRGSTSLSSSPSQSHHQLHHQGRPQYTRRNQQNHPYSSSNQGGSRIFSFSFSTSSIINRNQHQSSPPSSPSSPTYNHATLHTNSNNNNNSNTETEEQEYPQNPQDDYYPRTLTPPPLPMPIRSSSTEPSPRKSFSLTPRAARPPSPQLYSDLYENTSYQRQYSVPHPFYRSSMDSGGQRPVSPTRIIQGHHQESWGSTVRVESPVPMSDSESSQSESKDTQKDVNLRGRLPMDSFHRTSLESEHATTRFSYESQREAILKANTNNKSGLNLTYVQDISDEERQEPKRSRPSWRPSLSLIRQEGSSFNVLSSIQDQKRYPQNDQRRISDTPGLNGSGSRPKRKMNRQKKKKKRVSSRRHEDGVQEKNARRDVLPTLSQVLEKKTRYPLSYDDFEAFLRSQRAVEYLNFWADVTAHEQLCRTFSISERRLKREYQLEERAIARDRRRSTRTVENDSHQPQPHDGIQHHHHHHHHHYHHHHHHHFQNQEIWPNNRSRISEQQQQLAGVHDNFMASRSSIQLSTNDHFSFPPESRRYGIQDSPSSPSSNPVFTSQRRGSEQRAAGAYNRLLAGINARKTSLDTSRHSLDEISNDLHDVTPTDSTPTSHQIITATDMTSTAAAADGLRIQGRKPSVVEYFGNGIKGGSSSQISLPQPSPTNNKQDHHQHLTLNDEMAQLVEAVVELIPPSNRHDLYMETYPTQSQQSLRIVEPTITPSAHRKQSIARIDRMMLPQGFRRSGENLYGSNSPYSTIHDGSRPLLAQSYRTISLEDLEESALRIYRKYLIQLRTSSMAKEEEEGVRVEEGVVVATATVNISHGNGTISNPALGSITEKGILAPGWEGHAEQMIAEWNQRWRGRSVEARRARRMSSRKYPTEKEKSRYQEASQSSSQIKTGEDSSNIEEMKDLEEKDSAAADITAAITDITDSLKVDLPSSRANNSRRPKIDRTGTATGISSFILRLLRSETTVLELPTLTVNTTTVVTDADESYGSEYDEYDEDEYESDDDDLDGDQDTTTKAFRNRQYDDDVPVKSLQSTDISPVDNIVEDSEQGDITLSEIDTNSSAIQLQRIAMKPRTEGQQNIGQPTREISEKHHLSNNSVKEGEGEGEMATRPRAVLETQLPKIGQDAVARSAAAAAFYLPLECRERIHTQIHQEKRMDGTHVFGPAKGFVVDVVLREYYYPLFLIHVQSQNLGLLQQSHVNNRIKRRGMLIIGIILWIIVIAIQLTLVLMEWGGWTRPWVWVVGIIGGWPGAICLVTGITGFSPVLGLIGKIGEDRRVFRFRDSIEKSILIRHRRRGVWMLSYCLFWTIVLSIIFGSLPQK